MTRHGRVITVRSSYFGNLGCGRRCSTTQYGMGRGLVAAVAASLLMSVMADCSKSSKVVRSSNAWATGYDEWCGALTHASSPFQSSKVCARLSHARMCNSMIQATETPARAKGGG